MRFLLLLVVLCSCQTTKPFVEAPKPAAPKPLLFAGEEKHLRNIRQLTFGGENAEAYFSADGEWLIFQSRRGSHPCDEMYRMRLDGSALEKISTGKGRVTCGYFIGLNPTAPEPWEMLFASTHDFSPDCPPKASHAHGYVWPIYDSYELYRRAFAGGPLHRLTENKAYDAEATVSPDQKEIVFTSTRDGDLDLYLMNTDGTNVRRVTTDLGYDGGAFFSHDGNFLIYRAFHPKTEKERKDYLENLAKGVYRPSWLELFLIRKDGKRKRQITHLKGGTFAPYLFPNDKRVIFSSNYRDPQGRKFDLYAIDIDGRNLEQITFSESFDAFPMFSPDGKKLVWASNRNGREPGETNIFVADWLD